jgi:hypothetical protein
VKIGLVENWTRWKLGQKKIRPNGNYTRRKLGQMKIGLENIWVLKAPKI